MSEDRRPRGRERRSVAPAISFPVTRRDGAQVEADVRTGLDRRTLGFISTFRLFRGVPYELVERVVAACEIRDFPEERVLLKRGDVNTHVAIVIRGRLRIHLDLPDSEDFIEIAEGECAGEMSIIDGQPVSAFVVADAGCRLLLMEGTTFLAQVHIIPEVARNLLASFAERMRGNNALIIKRTKAAMELQRLQRELRFARHIQAGMMPQRSPLFPERRDIDCAAHMTPAREVGGDFYDAFFIDADTLFLTIGDACGKGMPAALLMVRTLTLLRTEAPRRSPRQRPDIRAIMQRVNGMLSAHNDMQMFSSAFAALFDVTSGRLRYVNAGHNPPLLISPGGRCGFLAEPRSTVLGIRERIEYRAGEVTLPAGAALLLYTDGITEAEQATGERYGEERLLAAVSASHNVDAGALIDGTLAAVLSFCAGAGQTDDLTLLALRYAG